VPPHFFAGGLMAEKRVNVINLRVGDDLLLELSRLSVIENRPLADMVHLIVERHVYGNRIPTLAEYEGVSSAYEHRKNLVSERA
jgi:hypothetical protein